MLILRVATSTAPTDLPCSFCSAVTPAGETFHVLETDPISESPSQEVVNEYETACPNCYDRIKHAAISHGIEIDWDLKIALRTRLAVGVSVKST